MKTLRSLFICLVILLGMQSNALAAPKSHALPGIVYVTKFGTSTKDCFSWADACDLQSALDYDDPYYEIWVEE